MASNENGGKCKGIFIGIGVAVAIIAVLLFLVWVDYREWKLYLTLFHQHPIVAILLTILILLVELLIIFAIEKWSQKEKKEKEK